MSATPLKQIGLNELMPTVNALSDAGGTSEHASWIRKPGNAEQVIRFINERLGREWCEVAPAEEGQRPAEPSWSEVGLAKNLPTNTTSPFSAPILYVQPSFEDLRCRFPAYSNPDNRVKRFDPIERCKSVSRENHERTFEYVHIGRNASTDEVLAEIDRKGLRPALYEELLGFAQKYPDEQRKYPIVAFGSEAIVDGNHYVACLWTKDDGRNPDLRLIVNGWHGMDQFLAVREGA